MTTWEDCYRQGRGVLMYPDEVIVQTLYHLGLNSGTALDVGCGSGRHLKMLWEKGLIARGVDGSATARDVAVALGLPRSSIDVKRFPPLDYTSNMFELVLAVNVLEHNIQFDREELLREIYRVMKPGGCFISRHVIWKGYLPQGAIQTIEDKTFERTDDTILHCYTQKEIEKTWMAAGFQYLQYGELEGRYPWMSWDVDNQIYVIAHKGEIR